MDQNKLAIKKREQWFSFGKWFLGSFTIGIVSIAINAQYQRAQLEIEKVI